MKEILNFFLEVDKLKKIKRTGWVLRGVKNPETIAQHIFRMTLMNWFLAKKVKPKLNIERVIKISLAHDLCEVYAGDVTPHWGLLPEDLKERKEFLKRQLRLRQKLKEERGAIKFQKENKSLEKLIKGLNFQLKKEITDCWLDYVHFSSIEGRFSMQGDKVETLLQAIEYFGSGKDSFAIAWWEECEDYIDNSILFDFLIEVEKKFYMKKKANSVLDFVLKIGKLKSLPRRGWVVRGMEESETIADHSFTVALMVWILGQKKKINLKRALKMALIHEICAVYAGDYTPHDTFASRPVIPPRYDILGPRWRWKKFWQDKPRLSKQKKTKRFFRIYQKERKALQKLIKKLPKTLSQEILGLWEEFSQKKSREANFVDEINCLATFLQACQYWQEDKKFPIKIFGEQVAEFISDSELIKYSEAIKKKFKLKI